MANSNAGGRTAPLKNVEALFLGIKFNGDSSAWDLAPDGRRLLIANGDTTNGTLVVGNLDGSRRQIWHIPFGSNFAWLPEGAGLIAGIRSQVDALARRRYRVQIPWPPSPLHVARRRRGFRLPRDPVHLKQKLVVSQCGGSCGAGR